jgi:hypothetical protein
MQQIEQKKSSNASSNVITSESQNNNTFNALALNSTKTDNKLTFDTFRTSSAINLILS